MPVAARQSDIPALTQALSRGAVAKSRKCLGKTALLIAAEKGQLQIAEAMPGAGVDVNHASLEKVKPLMAACYGGHVALVQRLISAGASTAPLDRLYKPAIVYAAGQGHAAVAALLDPVEPCRRL